MPDRVLTEGMNPYLERDQREGRNSTVDDRGDLGEVPHPPAGNLQPEGVDALGTEGDDDDHHQQDEAGHRGPMPEEALEHDPAEAEALDLAHLDRCLEVDCCAVDR